MSTSLSDTIKLSSEIGELERAFGFIDRFCETANIDEALKHKIFLVSEELTMNAAMHGYGGRRDGVIFLTLTTRGATVAIRYEDDAPPFDVLRQSPEPDLEAEIGERRVGGLGLHLIKALCSSLAYSREGGRNVVLATLAMDSDRESEI